MYNKDAIKIMKAGVKMTEKKRFVPLIIAGCVLILILACLGCTFALKDGSYMNGTSAIPEYILSYHQDSDVEIDYVRPVTTEECFYNSTIGYSDCAVVGELYKYESNGERDIWYFKNIETVYGEPEEGDVIVTDQILFSDLYENTFKTGRRYLLILKKENLLTMDGISYYLSGYADLESLYSVEGGSYYALIKKGTIASELVRFIAAKAKELGTAEEFYPIIYRGESLEEVLKKCDIVVRVKVENNINSGRRLPENNYICTLLEVLKGEYTSEKELWINADASKVSVKGEYIFALNKRYAEEDADNFFVQASLDAVIDAKDTEAVAKVMKALENPTS